MSGHRIFQDLAIGKESRANLVPDPGNAGVIDNANLDLAICELTVAASTAETRSLLSAASVPIDSRLRVVARTVGASGTVTVGGVTLAAAGQYVDFSVVDVGGTPTWVRDGGSVAMTTLAIPIFDWRVHDAPLTPLGLTALSADDLIFVPGTFGTNGPLLKGSDAGGTQAAQYGRRQIPVPADYVAGGPLSIVLTAYMEVVADTAATVDVVAYRTAAPTADICATAAQSDNSATPADKAFVLTPTNLVPGDLLDVRITGLVDDAGNLAPSINQVISAVKLYYAAYR